MTRKEIQKVNKCLQQFNTYCITIPLKEINEVLKENGVVLIQEDYTEWSGFLCGEHSHTTIMVGKYVENSDTFEEITNTVLSISWYKMPSSKYEIVTYLT